MTAHALVYMAPGESLDQFFHEIAQTPLLSAEQEKALAIRIAGGDEEAKKQLIEANLRLVAHIARKYTHDTIAIEDLIQEGVFGLTRAAEKYDGRGRFSTYATWWIRQTIRRGLDEIGPPVRLPVHVVEKKRRLSNLATRLESETGREPTNAELASELDMSIDQVRLLKNLDKQCISLDAEVAQDNDLTLGDLLEDSDLPVEEQVEKRVDCSSLVHEALEKLPAREADILRRRFGIGDYKPQTLLEIGEDLGVCRERIRQIEVRAMVNFRTAFRKLTARWAA